MNQSRIIHEKYNWKRLTPADGHYFFGYYDRNPWNHDQTLHLALKIDQCDRLPRPGETAEIGVVTMDAKYTPLTTTRAWCHQQGSMTLWLKHRPDCFNARVTHVVKRADGVAFTYAPKALPFPAIPAYTNAESFYPVTERLNQEVFIVEGLEPGTYGIAFDGREVGEFSAEDLYSGVNVALLDTPNQRIALAAADVAGKLKQKTILWRTVINMEKRILPKAGIDAADRAAADAYLEKWVGEMEAEKKPWAKYYRDILPQPA